MSLTSKGSHSGRLKSTDASFLYLERREAPMHIGAVCLFEGELAFEPYLATLERKLSRLPRFRERVVATPYYLGHPTWETDPDFDLRHQVRLHRLQGSGDERELRAKVNELIAGRLDRNRPLWELHVIQGLAGGESAVVSKIHHAMVDGVGGNTILTTIMDLERDPPTTRVEEGYEPTMPPGWGRRIGEALWDSTRDSIDAWSGYWKSLTEIGRHLDAERSQSVLAVLAETGPGLLRPPRPLPFNRVCNGERALYWTQLPFAEARAIRGALGGTVNDVMLAALAGAVTRYLEHHNVSLRDRSMRVMVPVNARPGSAKDDLGNRVSLLPVQIPLGIEDPVKLLRMIRGSTRIMKEGKVAEGVSLLADLGAAIPVPLQAAFGALARNPFPTFNLVCTNVPGPQIPLYADGQRLRAYYPYLPVGFHMGVGCAIFSYNQQLFIGLNSDVGACPDAERLCQFLDQAFFEMKELAGVGDLAPVVFGTSRSSVAPRVAKTPLRSKKTRAKQARSKKLYTGKKKPARQSSGAAGAQAKRAR